MTKFKLFTAPWCGPCKMLKPVIKEVDTDGKIEILDVEENDEEATKYKIRAVPTLLKLNDEMVLESITGSNISKEKIIELLN